MFKSLTLAATAFAITASGIAATPAAAQGYGYDQSHGYQDARDDRREYRDDRGDYRDDRDGYRQRGYRPRYNQSYDQRRYYNQSRRCDGGTGTILGAIAGGLLGNVIAGRGDRTLGTVLGAGGGAMAGRAVQKDGCGR